MLNSIHSGGGGGGGGGGHAWPELAYRVSAVHD